MCVIKTYFLHDTFDLLSFDIERRFMHIVYTCSGQRVSRYLFVILNGGSCTLCIPVQDSVSVVTCS